MWPTITVQMCLVNSLLLISRALTSPLDEGPSFLPVPSQQEEPPLIGTVHHIFYNVTPEGLVLKLESSSSLQRSNLSNIIPLNSIDPYEFGPDISTGFESQKENPVQPSVGSLQIIQQAEEKLQNFVRNIEEQIAKQSGALNETLDNFNRRVQNGSGGIQKFITDVQAKKSMNLQELIKRISADSYALLDKIRGGFEALGKGFKELTSSIFDGEQSLDKADNETQLTSPPPVNSTLQI